MNDGVQFAGPGQQLHSLREHEQAAGLRYFSLPAGYAKSQALAEYSNAEAALDAFHLARRTTRSALMAAIAVALIRL
jgi:hypothetical protein